MKAIVGIGSNVEPRRNVESACRRLEQGSTVLALSRPWWTPPVRAAGPPFLNCVAVLDSPRRPVALRRWLQGIEHDHGRVRTRDRAAPRTLDLDVLAVDQGGGWEFLADLAAQPFHLLPLRDVMPGLRLPDGRNVREHAEANPLPEAVPWMDAGRGRPIEKTAPQDGG